MLAAMVKRFGLLFLFVGCVSKNTSPRQPSNEVLYASKAISSNGLFSKSIEGPAVDSDGNLYVVNFAKRGTIGILRPGQEPELWLELPEGSVGNSIRFNSEQLMLVADYKKHQILSIDLKSKQIVNTQQNTQMNQPNDFTVALNGTLFLSDPSWSKKQKGSIWKWEQGAEPVQLATDLKAVNGIDMNPEETKMFFGESISGQIFSYDIANGALTNKKPIYKFDPDTIDGLRVDTAGNIYVARITKGQVDYISPDGKLIRSIKTLGKDPTNIAFGGEDGRTIYVTMRDGGYVESFRVEFPGREWALVNKK